MTQASRWWLSGDLPPHQPFPLFVPSDQIRKPQQKYYAPNYAYDDLPEVFTIYAAAVPVVVAPAVVRSAQCARYQFRCVRVYGVTVTGRNVGSGGVAKRIGGYGSGRNGGEAEKESGEDMGV